MPDTATKCTFMLAISDNAHSYITVEGVKTMYAQLAPVSPNDLHFPMTGHSDGRIVGYITSARLVEHENGAFIECDAEIHDDRLLGVPPAYFSNALRRAALTTINGNV